MLLADEFFLIAHDEASGRPRLHRRALSLGLAAGLLGELVFFKCITVRAGRVILAQQRPPHEPLARSVLAQLVAEPDQVEVRTWLAYLGQDARDAVGTRLVRAGVVWRQQSRRLLRQVTTYAAVDASTAAYPAARLFTQLTRREPMPPPDMALAALVAATGLADQIVWADDSRGQQHLRRVNGLLQPSLRELAAQTEAAVGDAVLSNRP